MGSPAKKVGKELGRGFDRVKDDPSNIATFGITDGSGKGRGFGVKGSVGRAVDVVGEVGKQLAESMGMKQTEEEIAAEQAQAQTDNDNEIAMAKGARKQSNANRAASSGAKIRLGRGSSTLGISKSGVQV